MGVARWKTSRWCPLLFVSPSKTNMAEIMLKVCLAAFIVNFAHWEITLVEGNTVTSAIQFTTSSSQSVEILSSIAPTKTTRNNSTLQTNLPDLECPDSVPCSHLGGSCIQCDFNYSCIYGEEVKAECKPISSTIKCTVLNL